MAEEKEIPQQEEERLWHTDYLNAACYCLESLKDIDGKLFSKAEEDRINATKRRMLRLIHHAAKDMHDDYFELPENVRNEDDDSEEND